MEQLHAVAWLYNGRGGEGGGDACVTISTAKCCSNHCCSLHALPWAAPGLQCGDAIV